MQLSIFSKSIPVLLAGLILSGCATPTLLPPKAEPFNFEQSAKDPAPEVKKTLRVDVSGKGLKDTKKFVIGTFQVRFREDLTGSYSAGEATGSSNYTGTVIDEYVLASGYDNLYQKVTDDLYKKFVAELTQRGYQIAKDSEIQNTPEVKAGMKEPFESGHSAQMSAGAISNPLAGEGQYGVSKYHSVMKFLGNLGNDVHYKVFYPTGKPGYNFGMMDGGGGNGDDIALPNMGMLALREAAKGIKAGVISVGFEVELMKFDRDRSGDTLHISHAPMVRTKLIALNMYAVSEVDKTKMFQFGSDNRVVVYPKFRGQKHNNWIKAMFDGDVFGYQWMEIDDGSVSTNGYSVSPDPSKFPEAFKKATDAHLKMLMHIVDHVPDYD